MRRDPRVSHDVVGALRKDRLRAALFDEPPQARWIGRYRVVGSLGRGGMGTVLEAVDDALERRVAIKLLHDDVSARDQGRLLREARALAKLSHPHVVQVYEVGDLDGQLFIAMELVHGQTLLAWMSQDPRPGWRRSVEVFVQVGAGLAAAHAQGLVHRDFKPSNAIVDPQGRARVLDFGLARRVQQLEEEQPTETRLDADVPSVMVEAALTRTGTVLGTPAYMPLEQMKGREADARSDQFSFCVALYEAVYGERPFEGSSMMALTVSMQCGAVRAPPKGSAVPVSLRTVLLRGLAVDPAQRWPSMDALLEQLHAQVAPRRRRWMALGVGVGLLGIGGGLGVDQYLAWQDRCSGARAQLAGVWDEDRRHAVQAAILGTALSYAPGTWERVEPRLDAYAEAWASEHTEVCEASTVRGEQSSEVMDLRMGCLRARRLQLRATVDELSRADATVVEHAVRAVTSLPRLERCADVEALEAEVPPPEDPVVAEQVAVLEDQLVEANAKQGSGKYDEGLRLTDEVVTNAVALGYEPLMARAWLRQGELREKLGDYEGAVKILRQAYAAAMARRMTTEAASASAQLVFVSSNGLARHEQARGWAEHAEPLSRAVGMDEARARYFHYLGIVAQAQGKLDEARDLHERALPIWEEALGPDHPNVASSLNNLGIVAQAQGKLDEARDLHERALSIREEALGPDHPEVAKSLTNLGNVAEAQGELDEARGHFARALSIREEALGPDHPEVATSLHNLGNVAHAQGNLEEARDRFARALATWEEALGPDHPNVASALNNLGNVERALGKLDEARECFTRALTLWEAVLGPDHPNVASALHNLGYVAELQGKLDEARDLYERALTTKEKALGRHHPNLGSTLGNLGNVAEAQGKLDEARALQERALAIWEEALGPDHPNVASALNNLGNVAQAQGKLDEARDSYGRAFTVLEKALGPDHPDVAYSVHNLGTVAQAQGKLDEARELLERALTIRTAHEVDPTARAETRFALARVLWDAPATHGRDRSRARPLAEQARDAYAEAGVGKEALLAKVEAWLATHRLP